MMLGILLSYTQDKMLLNIDGEYGGELPGEIINLQQHIEFYVSREFMQKEMEIRQAVEHQIDELE